MAVMGIGGQGPITFSLHGLTELVQKLNALNADITQKEVFRAAGAGARVVRNAARALATTQFKDSETLVKNIVVARNKRNFAPPLVMYDVGVRHGATKQVRENNDPFYWFMWEFGHQNLFTRQFEKRPFMTPAFENNKAESLKAMEKSLSRAVRRIEKSGRA